MFSAGCVTGVLLPLHDGLTALGAGTMSELLRINVTREITKSTS